MLCRLGFCLKILKLKRAKEKSFQIVKNILKCNLGDSKKYERVMLFFEYKWEIFLYI